MVITLSTSFFTTPDILSNNFIRFDLLYLNDSRLFMMGLRGQKKANTSSLSINFFIDTSTFILERNINIWYTLNYIFILLRFRLIP
ncbi:hypothetical protein CLMAG_21150 [Clostridium magnum DSM 2767]|uniref:Uncharacterized protein n=1 Tax=Clostridium magnum DSM 2767 TaxID=1121326 RepID=A0A161XD93_9CLOT|nr:hypothetical protein CLMAG_21150 [Clostridium magnum DSM 2767]SHH14013.1 hypothetical protein SAMN02745944_00111 [Clostridium magnum DSM 2767]